MGKWEMVRLGDVGNILTGNTPKTDDPKNYDSSDIPFYKPSDIQGNLITVLGDSENYISDYAREKARIAPANSVLVTCIGIVGKIGITTQESSFNQQINCVLPNPGVYNPQYLAYAIMTVNRHLNHIANAAVVPIINKSQFSDVRVPLPPLDVQKKIADVLDRATALIEKRKAQIAKLDLLIKSKFIDMFGDPAINPKGWEVSTLAGISAEKLSYGSGAAAVSYDDKVRYVRITDINDDGNLNHNIVSPSMYSEKYLLDDGDILFARSGATVGKTFKYTHKWGRCIYAGYLIKFTPNKTKVLPDYVFAYTKTDFYHKFIELSQRTVAQPNINARIYGGLEVCVPPIELQHQFADFVRQTEKSKVQMQQGLDKLELLYKSLMQKCFAGEMF
ncbi:MAG: restriction endonuclease subunit S [Defluviitaleaceae bacterium]|nr:restriction endonuclease subunit S [Defluviitaleaceae bacterium]